MTVNDAFTTFKSSLELPEKKQDKAAAAQNEMRQKLAQHLSIYDSFLAGS
ncbi:MAG TPA: hypothetical protein VGQ65_11595 [Thermoanaerobaculia bacterium]|jgi:hypothetical protein|nr:hypothetical protein [Thermoanaerobaculia bacterium]